MNATEKTPQQVFALMLAKWDTFDHTWRDGICLKLSGMNHPIDELITGDEYDGAFDFMNDNRHLAVGANPDNHGGYWWSTSDQDSRKAFVTLLSQLK